MWRGGQQQDVCCRPAELPARIIDGQTCQRLGELVPVCLADMEILLTVRRQFVGLVEHHEVVWKRSP